MFTLDQTEKYLRWCFEIGVLKGIAYRDPNNGKACVIGCLMSDEEWEDIKQGGYQRFGVRHLTTFEYFNPEEWGMSLEVAERLQSKNDLIFGTLSAGCIKPQSYHIDILLDSLQKKWSKPSKTVTKKVIKPGSVQYLPAAEVTIGSYCNNCDWLLRPTKDTKESRYFCGLFKEYLESVFATKDSLTAKKCQLCEMSNTIF